MTKLAMIGLAAAAATGMALAPMASALAQTYDNGALHKAQFIHRDRDRDRDRGFRRDHDRSRFGFGVYVGPRYSYDYDYCASHWRWDPYWGRWVMVRDCR